MVETMISIFYIVVLPSSILYGELDLMIMKLRVSFLVRGASPIVISKGIFLKDFSPENPIKGTFESTLDALMDAFITTSAEELLPPEGNVISFLLLVRSSNLFFVYNSSCLIMSIGASAGVVLLSFFPSVRWFLEAFTLSFLIPFTRWKSCPDFIASSIWFLNWRQSLVSCLWSLWKWQYLDMSRDCLLPNIRGGCSKLLAAFSVARIYLGLLDRLESSPWLGPRYGENLSLPFYPRLLSQEDFLNLSKFSLRSLGIPLVAISLASIQV
ncbi:hypothetical protein Tco_0807115 [Tanacetum coccineum]